MSDGLDPEIAALLSQSGGSAPADDGPVEAEAFSGIAADAVLVPAGVQSIADDAFDSGIIVIGEPGSYAELYSNRNELIFIPAA